VPLAPFGAKLADCFGAMASAMARRKPFGAAVGAAEKF